MERQISVNGTYVSQIKYTATRYHNDPEFRKKMNDATNKITKDKYHNNEEFRNKQLEYKKNRWAMILSLGNGVSNGKERGINNRSYLKAN
jgi:hypothetical protein